MRSALRDEWLVQVPLALWGGAWWGSAAYTAATVEEPLMAGTGVWVAPRRVLVRGRRVQPEAIALRWGDLRGEVRHGKARLACCLKAVVDVEAADDAEELRQELREAAAAARAAVVGRRSAATRKRRRVQALAVLAAEGDASSDCLLYTSPSPRDGLLSRMPSSA